MVTHAHAHMPTRARDLSRNISRGTEHHLRGVAQHRQNYSMATTSKLREPELYEPSVRFRHAAFSNDERVYVWGGRTDDFEFGSDRDESVKPFASSIEQFNPHLEVWRQLNTTGTPHLGLDSAACTSFGEKVYMYGGSSGNGFNGFLSCLDVKTLIWSLLSPETAAGGPMRKDCCGMVLFHNDKLAVIGGYGYPTGPTQPGSTFIWDDPDHSGSTNEFHVFNIAQGNLAS